jgi:uncharacterized damage-inducible protein DinB
LKKLTKEKTDMNRYFLIMLAAAFVGSAWYAQTANPLSTEVKGAYTNIKNNVLRAADKMPEEHYSFKATPEVQSFGQRIAHIADANMRTCAALKGEQKSVGAASKTTKADLVAALKESFAYCDGIYDSLTDTEATKIVSTGRGQRSKLAALWGIVSHDNEVYGTIGVYMRLKGIVPPSSEGR